MANTDFKIISTVCKNRLRHALTLRNAISQVFIIKCF